MTYAREHYEVYNKSGIKVSMRETLLLLKQPKELLIKQGYKVIFIGRSKYDVR